MPKSKFDAFYYGVGMKLDEASVDEAGKKLEGKLNKVVDSVAKNLTTISEAAAKGIKDVDTKKLVGSIVEAQKELRNFQEFDPSKLQKQIDSLNATVETLSTSLGDVATQLKEFTGDVASRLGQIEIKTSKQGKDALKADLKEMKTLAQGFGQILAKGEKIDTSSLDRYFQKIKAGFASLKASGNPMEMFADKELAGYFVDLTNILRQMGAPVEDLRADFFELSSAFKGIFEKTNASGAQTVFKNTGYQIETLNAKLRTAQSELARYEAEMTKMQSRVKSSGFAITVDDDKNLDFDKKIAKIQEYEDLLANLKVNTPEWFDVMKHQIALIQDAEKELAKMMKSSSGTGYLQKWQDTFEFDLDDKYSQDKLYTYVEYAKKGLEKLIKLREQTEGEISRYQSEIGRLTATEATTSSKKDGRTQKTSTQKQKASGVVAEVEAKIKINETEWIKTINSALTNIEAKGKVKPFKIKVEATQGKILEEIKKIKEATLMDKKNNGEKDVVHFNNNFNKFINNLKTRKQELIDELKQNWHPELKKAFSFRMELLGIDNKSVTENIVAHMLPTVDAINTVLEGQPIIFHSNIDTLVEEIKTKLQDIKIDIGAGNINVNPQGLSNANIVINGVIGRGGGVAPAVVPTVVQPTSTPVVQPEQSAPAKQSSGGSVDKQAIYNDAVDKFTKWINGFTDPGEALKLVKKQAQKLYEKLDLAEEGTDEYYEAQIQLAVLLGKWRGTVAGRYAKEGFRVSGAGKNWGGYLTKNGIIPDPKNSKVIGSMSALETTYGLKKPSGKSGSAQTPNTPKSNGIQTAEEQMASQLEAGRKIVENYIKLAKWAEALGPIAEGADIKIKESDFKDRDSIWRNGRNYTKEDIGKTAPGRKITFEDLDAFIAEYEQSENEEDRKLFSFLKNLIDAYKSSQQKLDSLLNEFSDSDVVGRYEFSDNKKETLAADTQSAYKTIMSKKGSKKAQQHLTDVFGRYNIDLSALPSAKTYAEQWQIIEQQIIGRKGLDFEGLMSELGSLKGNIGKTYENFMTLLKVSRAYMLATNSLDAIGQEASNIMRGTKAPKDIYRKEWDNTTGRWYYTNEKTGVKQEIITEGLRQELSRLAVVFIDKLGNAIAGVNTGKNIAGDYLGIDDKTSFTKIITFLTNALNQAAEIAIDTRKKRGMKGYENVTKWDAEEYTKRQNMPEEEYKDWTTASTEKSTIQGYIKNTQNVIDSKQKLKDGLLEENKKIQETIAALENKNNRTEEENKQLESLKTTLETNKKVISEYTAEIQRQKARLPELQERLKSADGKKVTYNKSYDQATTDLPVVQVGAKRAKNNWENVSTQSYTSLKNDFFADLIGKHASGEISKEDLVSMTQSIPKIKELNQQLYDGKISFEKYKETVENAYITMLNATTEEAKVSAKADAKRLTDAAKLVMKYKEEKKILEEIIRTQKPKEQPVPQPTSQGSSKPKDKSQDTPPASTQPASGGTQVVAGGMPSTTIDGGILLNLDNSGVAKETTVRAIYDLLSVKKNSDVDSRIEEVKKAIAAKEEEARVKADEERRAAEAKAEEKRKDAEAKAAQKKAEDAKRKAAEAEAARRKAEEDAERRKAEEEAARKKAEEAKKQVEAEAARKKSEAKAKEEARKRTPEAESKKKKSTEQSFFEGAKKTYQETSSGNKVFREQRVVADKGAVIKEVTGLFGSIVAEVPKKFETHGHTHPRDSLYSGTDIKTMAKIRGFNSSYNTDWLATPSYIYKITGLASVLPSHLESLAKTFESIESSGMNNVLSQKTKESELYHFAQSHGLDYSKNIYDEFGNLTNVVGEETFISKEALETIKEFIRISQELKTATGDKKQTLLGTKKVLYDKLQQDAVVGPLMLSGDQEKIDERSRNRALSRKMRSSTLIQEAIDYDFDFSLFISQFKDFFDALDILGEKVKPNSSLAQIKQYIQELSGLDKSSAKYKDTVKKIQTLSQDAFGRSNSPHMDVRYLSELEDIASRDKSGKIRRTIGQVKADNLLQSITSQDDTPDEYKDKSLGELRAELARLEALRDNGEVDPRFATAANQEIIIGLLKNGISVSGKADGGTSSSEGSKEKKPRVPQMPNVAKASIQAEEIGKLTNINRESSLYQQYAAAKEMLDEAISSATAKGKDRTKDDVDQIRVLLSDVTRLGKQIIKTSESFDQFKERGGKSFAETIADADALKNKMFELASENALSSKMLLRDVAYDDVTQKMTYNLIDLEGNVTRVTMAYNDLLGAILTTSDKTTNSASKIYNAIEGEMINRIGVNDTISKTPILEQSSQYQLYLDAYNAMMKAQDDLRAKGEMATKEERDNLISLTNTVASTRSEFEKLVQASMEFDAKIKNPATDVKDLSSGFDMNMLEQEMKNFVLSQEGLTKSQKEMIESTWVFKNAQDGATYSVRQGKDEVASMSVIFDEGTKRIGQYTIETKKYQTGMERFMDSLKGKWQEVARYLLSFGSLYRVWAVLKQGITYVKEIDSALTELKKVTNETEETYEKFLNTAAKTADKVGSTIKEVVSSTADWARLGYSMEEAARLSESTAVLLNVSEFQSIDDATSALTSTMQAFGYVAEDSMQVVDVLNEVGKLVARR